MLVINLEVFTKQSFTVIILLVLLSLAHATVQLDKMYEPIVNKQPVQTGCAVSFQPHQHTNTKVLIMTYADSESQACAIRGKTIAFQCDGYFCHSGDMNAYKTNYLALYTSADSAYLLLRTNHCTSGCAPFGPINYLPLPPQNANYRLKENSGL